ncbi:MAG: FkbM family methyltransferase [Gemmatimonadales bacterium]
MTVAGLTFSLDNPLITTREKSHFYLGIYELPEIELARRHLDGELPVIELGGGIGVVSCVINTMLKHPHEHLVVEGNTDLLATLEENRRLNGCGFRVRNVALAYGGGDAVLSVDSFATGRVGAQATRRLVVPARTLADLLRETGFARIDLVADIEGAEVELVAREGPLLARHARTLILEAHPRFAGPEATAGMLASIRALGFAELGRSGHVHAFRNRWLPLGGP